MIEKLVEKVGTIQRELGSLGGVLMERMEKVLQDGIDPGTAERLDAAEDVLGLRKTARGELETQRDDLAKLRAEIDEAGTILNRSRTVMDFDPALLRDAIDVGLELAGGHKLAPLDGTGLWQVPDLPESWQATLDTLRPPRGRDEFFWEWRRKPPQPVLFQPPPKMNSALVHLHLQHPFVQRLLGRFLAQGFSAHDLSRVTIVRNRHDALVRVIAFGRLSLFGAGAARLHDQLVSVAARWVEGSPNPLRAFAEEADRKAIDMLERILAESPTLEGISRTVQERVRMAAPGLLADLWSQIREEADAEGDQATRKLRTRGQEEAEALRGILETQRSAILRELDHRRQVTLDFTETERQQREQFEQDNRHMESRLAVIDKEIAEEPVQVESLYQVIRHRLEPVGLVCLWPETRG